MAREAVEALEVWLDEALQASGPDLSALLETLQPMPEEPTLSKAMQETVTQAIERLGEPRSPQVWSHLCELVRSVPEADRAAYQAVLKPHLLDALSAWPDADRQLVLETKTAPELVELARWFSCPLLTPQGTRGLREHLPALQKSCCGLELKELGANAVQVAERLTAQPLPRLRALSLSLFTYDTGLTDQLDQAFAMLFTGLGPQLEALRLNAWGSGANQHVTFFLERLQEHAAELKGLTSLELNLGLLRPLSPAVHQLVEGPLLGRLKRFAIAGLEPQEQETFIEALLSRENNLEALGVDHVRPEQAARLLEAPSLRSVERWALHASTGILPWGQWRSRRTDVGMLRMFKSADVQPPHIEPPSSAWLDREARCASLANLDLMDPELAAVLEDQSWPQLIALDLSENSFTPAGLERLFMEGPLLFPSLRELNLKGSAEVNLPLLQMIGRSKLLPRLRVLRLSWKRDFPSLLEAVSNDQLPASLRQLYWKQHRRAHELLQWRKLAKQMKLPDYGALKRRPLIEAIGEALHVEQPLESEWSPQIERAIAVAPEFTIG